MENQEFQTPIVASLKKMYPNASPSDIKKKMLRALASQLDQLNDDDFMSTSSKTPSTTHDKTESVHAKDEEDNEDYLGSWLNNLDKPDKSLGKKPVQ